MRIARFMNINKQTMDKILELEEKIGRLVEDKKAKIKAHDEILKSFETAENTPSDEDYEAAKTRVKEINELDEQIDELRSEKDKLHFIEREKAKRIDRKAASERRGTPEQQAARNFSLARAISDYAEKGKVEGLAKELTEEARNEGRSLSGFQGDLAIPSAFVRLITNDEMRAMSVGTTTAGGHTVSTDTMPLVPVLRPRLKVIAMGTQVASGMKGDMTFPRHTTVETASMNTEVGTGNAVTPTFDTYSVEPHRIEAYTTVSKQLLVQSNDISEQWIRQNLEFAIAKQLDTQVLNGAGTGANIEGIANISGIGSVTYNASDPFGSLVDLETQISQDDADVMNMGYLTTPQMKGSFKQERIDSGSGIMVWGQGAAELNGYRADVSTQVPTVAGTPDEYYIYFGNWADGTIYQWSTIDIVVDPYSLRRTAQVEVVVNGWYDYALRHVESMALCSDAVV